MATTMGTAKDPTEASSMWPRSHDSITHCARCGGLMVREQLIDLPAHRCVQCGEVVDPVILQNRQRGATIGMN